MLGEYRRLFNIFQSEKTSVHNLTVKSEEICNAKYSDILSLYPYIGDIHEYCILLTYTNFLLASIIKINETRLLIKFDVIIEQ